MLAGARPAAQVLAALDHALAPPPWRLVAHHAPTEAGLIARHRDHCPTLAAAALLDTVRMARAVIPYLGSYRLDRSCATTAFPAPRDRHRAMPDAEVTAQIFRRLLADGARARPLGHAHRPRRRRPGSSPRPLRPTQTSSSSRSSSPAEHHMTAATSLIPPNRSLACSRESSEMPPAR